MKLTETFWKSYELDLQEVKISYLNWAIGYAMEPRQGFRHLFLWDHQKEFFIVNSRYGRSFAISPFGPGVRGVPRPRYEGIPRGLDEIDLELKSRLARNTQRIRNSIRRCLAAGDFDDARETLLNFYWLKLGDHELLSDRIQYGRDRKGKIAKGRRYVEKPENWLTVLGIRNKVINSIRYAHNMSHSHVKSLNIKLPGLSRNSTNTFLSSSMTWNRFASCSFDTGPVMWSKSGFVNFKKVKQRMRKIGWPYHGTASQVLRPFYTIVINYRRPPIRGRGESDEGYSLKSMRRRSCQLYEIIDSTLDEIYQIRERIGQQNTF
jgi:hypothetical protein